MGEVKSYKKTTPFSEAPKHNEQTIQYEEKNNFP